AIAHRKQVWPRLPLSCVGAVLLISMTAPQVYAAGPSYGWTFFPGASSTFSFASASTVLVPGKRTADGRCSNFFEWTKDPDQPPVGAVELAINQSTCEQQVLVGELAALPRDASGPGYATSSSVVTNANASDQVSPLVTEERQGHYY